jgi:hypothetical protein
MENAYLFFSDGSIFKDGKKGYVSKLPSFVNTLNMLSWGKKIDSFYLDKDGARVDLTAEALKTYTDELMPLINESSFRLSDLNNELHDLESSLEATDYVEEGVDAGTLKEADYSGVLADRVTWKARKAEVKAELAEIEANRAGA